MFGFWLANECSVNLSCRNGQNVTTITSASDYPGWITVKLSKSVRKRNWKDSAIIWAPETWRKEYLRNWMENVFAMATGFAVRRRSERCLIPYQMVLVCCLWMRIFTSAITVLPESNIWTLIRLYENLNAECWDAELGMRLDCKYHS